MSKPNEPDNLLDHSYDGIQEFDNPMPRWWVYIFWATIVFSVLYWLDVPGVGQGKGRVAEYEREMQAAAQLAAQAPATGPGEEQLAALAGDPGAVGLGKQTFGQHCAACHRADGGGMIGPNLTDDAWLHGGSLVAIHKSVADGILEKGMPAWGKVLKPQQVDAVVAYVHTLRGTNPPDPKAPQGSP